MAFPFLKALRGASVRVRWLRAFSFTIRKTYERQSVNRAFKTLFVMMFFTFSTFGQTNFLFYFEYNGRAYTNVTIEPSTPATAMLTWDGGGMEIPITNLSRKLQLEYNYNPQKAQEYLDDQALKKAAAQARLEQESESITVAKNTLGSPQKIRILKVINASRLQIVQGNAEIAEVYIHNLPYNVITFVRDLNNTQAAVDADSYAYYNDLSEGGTFLTRQELKAAAINHLQWLLPQVETMTVVTACPTAYVMSGGIRQWEYQTKVQPAQQDIPAGQAQNHVFIALKNGIPENIYNAIAAKAERDWPGDYDEQEYIINQQVSAYKRLHQ